MYGEAGAFLIGSSVDYNTTLRLTILNFLFFFPANLAEEFEITRISVNSGESN